MGRPMRPLMTWAFDGEMIAPRELAIAAVMARTASVVATPILTTVTWWRAVMFVQPKALLD
jgi:hypothetical protein